ncbi:DUF4286 family protein [Pseudomarimonas salicorniae]|uniref:DUF4286 family protein n=1 Tax=Pseudomarimonas salicorniae TaxID=2933270 RepID=A0ABT0GD58_9GAMM|nr:DUF4286 family protein [Lysobacter sp. CAU 1642]
MIVYEVNLSVEAAIATEYRAWLDAHIAEMLGLPGFLGASLSAVDEPAEDGRVQWSVAYRLRDAASLEAYLATHAPRMREDGQRRFGGRFRASRRVLRPLFDQG